jgi:transcriptional regulator GlxA family with amidase domain
VTIETTPISQFEGVEIDTIVIPGALEIERTLADRRLVDWLAAHAPMARRTASGCAGAFLLAEAGLLNGRRVLREIVRHFPYRGDRDGANRRTPHLDEG